MTTWQAHLRYDPIPPLLAAPDEAIPYFTHRDLLGEPAGPVRRLWHLPQAQRILNKQQPDGAWPWTGPDKHPAVNHRLVETWRWLRFLVDQYGFTRDHPQIATAAEYLFSCQTPDGDFRGILANQYATYYSGAILALLVRAGYIDDPRVEAAFRWLLAMRQDDGGWTIPMLTHKLDREAQYRLSSEYAPPLELDRAKPFSHNATGMILRAFADHPRYRHSEAALVAAGLLKSRFFQPDVYTSYQAATYWVRFDYPFWWNNLVAALDSLSLIGLSRDDEQIRRALAWLVDHQQPDGLWRVTYAAPEAQESRAAQSRHTHLWVTLAICRVLSRFDGQNLSKESHHASSNTRS
jgi:hypothetical protein